MKQIKKNEENKFYDSTERVYYNCLFVNSNQQRGTFQEARFIDNRSQPIIDKPSDYTMSVVRFRCDTSNIPLLLMPIQPLPNTDINKSIYSITLSYTPSNYNSQKYVMYSNTGTDAPVPPNTNGIGKISNIDPNYAAYYSIYVVDRLLELINNALNDAYTDIVNTQWGGIPDPNYSCAPQIGFDSTSQLFFIIAPVAYSSASPLVEFYMNKDLYYLFDSSFLTTQYYYDPQPFNKDIQINIYNNGANNITLPAPFGNSVKYYQNFPTLGNISIFSNLIFAGNNIPCRYELLPNRGVNTTNSDIGNTQFPIITDFTLDNSNGTSFRNQIYYVPSAEYRRVNLISDTPLTQIDLSIYWTDKYNNLYPLLLNSSQSCTLKILFEKKY